MCKKYLFILLSICYSIPAFAEMEFSDADTDGDGYVSVEESTAIPGLKDILDDFDQDGDARLDEDEFNKSMEVMEPGDKGG